MWKKRENTKNLLKLIFILCDWLDIKTSLSLLSFANEFPSFESFKLEFVFFKLNKSQRELIKIKYTKIEHKS